MFAMTLVKNGIPLDGMLWDEELSNFEACYRVAVWFI